MISTQQTEHTALSRKNTFQKMLDAEKKNKLNRMQISTNSPPITQSSPALDPSNPLPNRIPTMASTGRTMSMPALSIEVPPPKHTRFLIKDGDAVPEETGGDEEGSETSSICQSPGWDNLMGSKKKKEKKAAKERKKEKEKAEAKAAAKAKTEAKHAEKVRNRLSKAAAPPTNKRLSKLGIMGTRSKSVPLMSRISESTKALEEESKEDNMATHKAPVDAARDFIQSTQAVPVPWRSSHGTPTEMTPTEEQEPPVLYRRPTATEDGFIGGLKLRLADEASIKQKTRTRSVVSQHRIQIQEAYKLEPIDVEISGNTSPSSEGITESPTEGPVNSVRTPQQWESIHEQAARMMRPTTHSRDESVESTPKARKKTYPPTSSFFSSEGRRSSPSIASLPRNESRPGTGGEASQRQRTSSVYSSDAPATDTRDTSVERGNSKDWSGMNGYVGRQRKQSIDQSVSGFDDENKIAEAGAGSPDTSPRGRRLSWASVKTFGRSSSIDAPSTIKASEAPLAKAKEHGPPKEATPTEKFNLLHSQRPISAVTGGLQQRRTSKNTIPTLKNFKSAAKAAFSRNSTPQTSPVENQASPKESPTSITSQHRLKNQESNEGGRLSKAEQFFGESVSKSFAVSNETPLGGERGHARNYSIPLPRSKGHTHSRSATDSSEEYSTFDESSNATTPMVSKAPSRKDSSSREDDLVTDLEGYSRMKETHIAYMTNALPESKDDFKPPQLERSGPAPRPSSGDQPKEVSSIQRQQSLSRSLSSPELKQDLSFLPPLKHQALTKPTKEKDTDPSKAQIPQTKDTKPTATTLIKSPTIQQKPTDASPVSSQYLQNARLALPHLPRASHTPSLNPAHQGQDPIAKMFVICCGCKYYHDLPSKIYECMARSETVVEDKDLGVRGLVSTSVRCPWCGHGMTTACCQGWAAVVVLRERLH